MFQAWSLGLASQSTCADKTTDMFLSPSVPTPRLQKDAPLGPVARLWVRSPRKTERGIWSGAAFQVVSLPRATPSPASKSLENLLALLYLQLATSKRMKPVFKSRNPKYRFTGVEVVVKTRLDQSGFADGSDVMAFVPEEGTKNYMRPGRLGFLAGLGF